MLSDMKLEMVDITAEETITAHGSQSCGRQPETLCRRLSIGSTENLCCEDSLLDIESECKGIERAPIDRKSIDLFSVALVGRRAGGGRPEFSI